MVTRNDGPASEQALAGLPGTARIKAQRDFDAVFQGRKRLADDVLIIHWRFNRDVGLGHRQGPSPPGTSPASARLGLSVGRKAGNAVARNHWKRLIREAFRRLRSQLPSAMDLVVRPQPGAQPDHARVFDSLKRLTDRIRSDQRAARK